jgi:hypothetical protein
LLYRPPDYDPWEPRPSFDWREVLAACLLAFYLIMLISTLGWHLLTG